ncbi:MAG: hypothetical protein ACT6RD_06025 [Brevundimonas sp.]|uniref:hypothetical protein n=1 Tax=Brevundimonas sp. TaxID=1871086 RepID=UPI0040331776
MRRLILAIAATLAATLALAGCERSANAELQREVNALVDRIDLPEEPAFPSLNADTVAWLSRDVPELAAHRAAIEAADKAILARAVAQIGSTDLSVSAASGPEPVQPGALRTPVSTVRRPIGLLDWVAPPAHAQALESTTVTAALSGMSGARMAGGIVNSGDAGTVGSRTETINGAAGEKATITISRDADGQVTTSLESNVDVPPLGLVAGAKTTFITKGLCPDASGRVEFTVKLSQAGKAGAGGAAAVDSQVEAHVVLNADDNAEVADQDIQTRYSRKSTGRDGTVSYQGEVDWQRSGRGEFRPGAERRGAETGAVTDAMRSSAMVQAVTLAIGAIEGAQSHWSSGACIRIDAQSPGRVDPKAKSDIPVAVISRTDGAAVAARVTATLTGGESISPAVIDRTPGTIVHTAPNEKKARMSIRLDAVSRRGKATLTLDLLISEGAYSIEGGADEFHGTGLICDIGQPFTVEGNGVTVNFTPSSPQGGSYRYSGSMYGFRLSGNGTYTVTYNGDVATGIVATGPGSVGTAYGAVSGSGDEHYELTPSHNYNCE